MKNFSSTSSTSYSSLKGGSVKNTHRLWLSTAIGVLVANLIFLGIVILVISQTDFELLFFKPLEKAFYRASSVAIENAKVAASDSIDSIQDMAIEGTSQRVVDAVNNTREDIINDAREAASSYLDQYS